MIYNYPVQCPRNHDFVMPIEDQLIEACSDEVYKESAACPKCGEETVLNIPKAWTNGDDRPRTGLYGTINDLAGLAKKTDQDLAALATEDTPDLCLTCGAYWECEHQRARIGDL